MRVVDVVEFLILSFKLEKLLLKLKMRNLRVATLLLARIWEGRRRKVVND